MNLENLNVRELNTKEVKSLNGGFWPITWTAGWGNIMGMNPRYWQYNEVYA